jgi:DNA-binding NarL/FixJ family response regulator
LCQTDKLGVVAHELPETVTRAPTAAESPARRRLRILYVGDAALARECLGRPGGSIDLVAADPRPDGTIDYVVREDRSGTTRVFDLLFIEQPCPGVETVAILKDLAARNLHLPVVIVADWDEDLAVRALELGASDYVLKSRASFRAVYFRLHRLIAHSALLDERARLRVAQSATIDMGRATEEDVARRVAEAEAARETAEHRLNDVVSAL